MPQGRWPWGHVLGSVTCRHTLATNAGKTRPKSGYLWAKLVQIQAPVSTTIMALVLQAITLAKR